MLSVTPGRMVVRPILAAPRSGLSPRSFLGQQRRMFHEYQIGMLDRLPETVYTKEAARDAVDKLFAFVRKTDLAGDFKGRLRVLTLPEFAFNRDVNRVFSDGDDMMSRDEASYNASSPLGWEVWQEIIRRSREHLSKLPGGLVFVVGGTAVDTGERMPDGRIRGANIGAVIESGPTADCVFYNKRHHDKIDRWDLQKYSLEPADDEIGPRSITITDPSGGKSRIITVFNCSDMERGPFPRDMAKSDMVLCSSYGTPQHWQPTWVEDKNISEYAIVAVNDSSIADSNMKHGPTGIMEYVQKPKHPWLASFHSFPAWAGLGDYALKAYDALLRISPTEALAKELGFVEVLTTTQKQDGLRLVMTGVRRFGPETREAEDVTDQEKSTDQK